MTEIQPTVQTKLVVEPTAKWEQRGNDTLKQFFEILHGPTIRLSTASNHYLDSYQGDSTPGVASSLNAGIKNTKDVYRNSAGGDAIMEHMVNSAAALTKQVEGRLNVIRALTPESSRPSTRLSNAEEDAAELLKKLFGTKDLQEFNSVAHELTTTLEQEVSRLRNGATSGQTASQEITQLSKTEQDNFGTWWRSHYKDGYGTIPGYQQSLQAFAETAQDRNRIYHDETKSVLDRVPTNATDPVIGFVNDFRQSQFPKSPNQ